MFSVTVPSLEKAVFDDLPHYDDPAFEAAYDKLVHRIVEPLAKSAENTGVVKALNKYCMSISIIESDGPGVLVTIL